VSAYRDRELACPKCTKPLRAFHDRLVCDECSGIQLDDADLKRSVEELAGAVCRLVWNDAATGRACPQCVATMTSATLAIEFDDVRLRSSLPCDRCPEHGAWFPDNELAQVFLLVERRINRGTAMAPRNLPRDTDLSRFTGAGYAVPDPFSDPKKK
jgi:hypothetical protein